MKRSTARGWISTTRFHRPPPAARGMWRRRPPRPGARGWPGCVRTPPSPPWGPRAWRSLRYDLSRPSASPDEPEVFFRRSVGNYIGNEGGAILRAEPGRFQVEHDGSIVDPSILVRRHVETYAVDAASVRQVQPVAFRSEER